MKKIFFAALILISMLGLAACSEPCVECVDSDSDGYCDNCYQTMPGDDQTEDSENSEGDGNNDNGNTGDSGNIGDSDNTDGSDNTGDSGNTDSDNTEVEENNGSNDSTDTNQGENNENNNQDGNTEGDEVEISFTIAASHSVIALGEGQVVFSVNSGNAGSVIYKVNGAAITGSSFTPTATGTYIITAASGDKGADNSLTLTVLKSNETLAGEINAAFSGASKITLGTELDIGLTAETAPYYSVAGSEGYIKINEAGKLEFIGLKRSGAAYSVTDHNGNPVAVGIYNMTSSDVLSFVISALYNMGAIPDRDSDVPNEKLQLLTELNVLGYMITDSNDFYCLKYLTSLEDLNISGSPLGDLGFLSGLHIRSLDISMPKSLEASEGGESIYNVIDSLPNLETLTMYGAVGYLNKETYNRFIGKVIMDELDIMMSYGAWMTDAQTAADFSATVFFSIDELRAQSSDDNTITIRPAGDFKHVILVLGASDAKKFMGLTTSYTTTVDLYGAGGTYYTPIYHVGSNELAINLYNYSIDAYGMDKWGNAAVFSAQNTSICARQGDCYIKGADSYPLSTGRTDPTIGIECFGDSLTVSSATTASLTVYGGYGKLGEAGVADGSNPSSTLSAKHGEDGGDGAVAIWCNAFKYGGGDVKAIGGDGNGGGAGGAGTKENMFSGGYNGGDGGDGGDGAVAISCTSNSPSGTGAYISAESGNGGSGGAAGAGYAAGKDGSAGAAGSKPSDPVLIR